jgi:hypothetical protein
VPAEAITTSKVLADGVRLQSRWVGQLVAGGGEDHRSARAALSYASGKGHLTAPGSRLLPGRAD